MRRARFARSSAFTRDSVSAHALCPREHALHRCVRPPSCKENRTWPSTPHSDVASLAQGDH
jgi:hypothetical protein